MSRLALAHLAILIALAGAPLPGAAQVQDPAALAGDSTGHRFAYVNTDVILAAAPQAQVADQQWRAEAARYQAELDSLVQRLDSLYQDYQQKAATMTPQARTATEQGLQAQELALRQREVEIDSIAGRRQLELVAPVYEEIGQLVEDLRVELGFDFILDTTSRAIIAARPELDLTELVIERLQGASGAGGGVGPPGVDTLRTMGPGGGGPNR